VTLTETLPNHSEQCRLRPWGVDRTRAGAVAPVERHTHADFPQVCTQELLSFKSTASSRDSGLSCARFLIEIRRLLISRSALIPAS